MRSAEFALGTLVLAVVGYHLVISPYTKVEESFNLQAIHDILNFGISKEGVAQYDHHTFPGVVPRTFVGSLAIAGAAAPIVYISNLLGFDLKSGSQLDLQFIVRLVLGLANGMALIHFGISVRKISFNDKRNRTTPLVGAWYLILLLSQFHILYYSSRTLPNFIVLPLVNYALSQLLLGDTRGLIWLAFAGVVFRLEVGIFAVVIAGVTALAKRQADLTSTILALAAGTIFGLLVSLAVDSYFWNYICVPELVAFKYNVIDGKSSDWGTEPYIAYFQKYLLQLFRPPIVLALAVLGSFSDPADDGTELAAKNTVQRPSRNSLRILTVSALVYIAIMSFQPHKEWRFIIYTVPVFTLQAANGLDKLSRKPGFFNRLLILVTLALIAVSIFISGFLGYISSFNYPGGEALAHANDYISQTKQNSSLIHLDVACCMTGASRFGEIHQQTIVYDKTEDPMALEEIWGSFDFMISVKIDALLDSNEWKVTKAFSRFETISLMPLFNIAYQKSSQQNPIKTLVAASVEAFLKGDVAFIRKLFTAPILESDYLFLYERVKHVETTIPGAPIVEEVLEKAATEEPDLDQIADQINEEIDEMESNRI